MGARRRPGVTGFRHRRRLLPPAGVRAVAAAGGGSEGAPPPAPAAARSPSAGPPGRSGTRAWFPPAGRTNRTRPSTAPTTIRTASDRHTRSCRRRSRSSGCSPLPRCSSMAVAPLPSARLRAACSQGRDVSVRGRHPPVQSRTRGGTAGRRRGCTSLRRRRPWRRRGGPEPSGCCEPARWLQVRPPSWSHSVIVVPFEAQVARAARTRTARARARRATNTSPLLVASGRGCGSACRTGRWAASSSRAARACRTSWVVTTEWRIVSSSARRGGTDALAVHELAELAQDDGLGLVGAVSPVTVGG